MEKPTREQVERELRQLLAELLREHRRGADGAKLARAHGYLDGYMRSLVDAGTLTQRQLLSIVREQRSYVDGPATAAFTELDVEAA